MKKSLSIFLALVYTSMLLVPLIPYMEYAIHKEHIITHHCVNPDTECEGMCYVNHKIHDLADFDGNLVQQLFQSVYLQHTESLFDLYPPVDMLIHTSLSGYLHSGFTDPPSPPPRA